MSSQSLHHALLRPAVIHILRAAGFHSTRPSVLDTLTDLCARYLTLLASRTAQFAYERTLISDAPPDQAGSDSLIYEDLMALSNLDKTTPTVSDVRLALNLASCFASSLTATEEAWQEVLRKPLNTLPAAAQEKERRRRDAEDTKDVRELTDWIAGPVNREIRRIAGLLVHEQSSGDPGSLGLSASRPLLGELSETEKEDYLTVLQKKHSKTGDAARYAGTVLGARWEDKGMTRIEGGPITMTELAPRKRRFDAVEEKEEAGRSVVLAS